MIEPLTDPREIRKLLAAVARGARMDGKERWSAMSPVSPMVRAIESLAYQQGLSGEDAMTVLAYHALLRYEELIDRCIEDVNLNPSPVKPPPLGPAPEFKP